MISRVGYVGYSHVRLFRISARRRNYYDTLGVSRDASDEEIKKAYKNLARKYHPDKPTGNNDIFLRVQEANSTLSNSRKRAEYDQETFGVAEKSENEYSQSGTKFDSTNQARGSPYYSPEYVDSLRKWDEWSERFQNFSERLQLTYIYIKQNTIKVLVFIFMSSSLIYGSLYYLECYLDETCSEYYYDRHERAITIPQTTEWHQKMSYIDKMIANNIPEDPAEQIEKFGSARVEWLKDFYRVATLANRRGVDNVDLRDAVRFLPFVGLAFLQKKIPLDPSLDFDDSYKCKMCEFLYGKIFKFYPEEFLEEYPNRASFFIREFLPNKTLQEVIKPENMLNPDYVDPFTGKKNDEHGFQEWEENYIGDRENQITGYKNQELISHHRRATETRNISKYGVRAGWER